MSASISVRLDDSVRDELEAQARSQGIGLATLLRDLATASAQDARRARIRLASDQVGRHLKQSAAGRSFFSDWGSPARV